MSTKKQTVTDSGNAPSVGEHGETPEEMALAEKFVDSNLSFKLRRFAALVEAETIERLKADDLSCEANILNAKTNFHVGRKYSRVDVGSSGKYMIDNQTEEIFGIKAYGVIHKGHRFGTLDTTDQWHWGEYRAIRKNLAA